MESSPPFTESGSCPRGYYDLRRFDARAVSVSTPLPIRDAWVMLMAFIRCLPRTCPEMKSLKSGAVVLTGGGVQDALDFQI